MMRISCSGLRNSIPEVLRERYEKELHHNLIGNVAWHDGTLKLWIEIFEVAH